MCWVSKETCDYHFSLPNSSLDDPVNLYIKPTKILIGHISKDTFSVGGDLSFMTQDTDGNVLAEFTLLNFTTEMMLKNHPERD
mmetsp:Transcript_744/g.927  ORF Transcript_744/g.927 Transcript_744/m.927 type:complete len:83 (+) Transcript_744:128-376(+)